MSQFAYVLRHHDADPIAHRYMGYIYNKQGKTDKAIEEYRRALELYPGYKASRAELEKVGIGVKPEDMLKQEGNQVG